MQAQATTNGTRRSRMAEEVKAKDAENPIAALPAKATTESIREAKPNKLATGNTITGQYLADRLVLNAGKEELTKMDIIRSATEQCDVGTFKKAVADFVGIFRDAFDKAKGTDEETIASARLKTAQNHQSVLRAGYGAIRFAADKLAELGYDPKTTGYQVMRVMAIQALKDKGINWTGEPVVQPEQRQQRKAQTAQARYFTEAMAEYPQKPKEDRAEYFSRLDKIVAKRMADDEKEQHAKLVERFVAEFRDKAGALLPEVIKALQTQARDDAPA
jgi:hypothetical protein